MQMVQEFVSWIIDGEVPAQFSYGSWFSGFVEGTSHTVPFFTTIPSREKLISFPDLTLLDTWPWEICTQDKGKLLVMCKCVQTGLLRLAFRYLQASLVVT